jgi:GNAT superfamily N-acetyltransferase
VSAGAVQLWATARKHLTVLFGYVDGAEMRLHGSAVLGISGGPTADFNMALFDEGPDDRAIFDEFFGRMTALGLPGVFMMSTAAARRLGPIAAANGLVEAGAAPLMARSATDLGVPSADFEIERVIDSAGMAVVTDLAASAFALDPTWCGRTFTCASLLEAPGLEFFIARRGAVPMSSVTTTGTGATIGIWTMSTPPDKQRQGAGRAVLLSAMDHHRKRGAETFYLVATEAGKPLYDSLGFKTVDDIPIWVIGHSEQFAGH